MPFCERTLKMIYRFKFYGHYFALDTESATVHKLTELQFDMLTYLSFPFEDVFPSTLRYDLAKYESSELKEAYFDFKKLSDDGVFMSASPLTLPAEPKASKNAEKTVKYDAKKFVFASEVIRSADEGCSVLSAEEDATLPVKEIDYDILFSEYERVAKEIIKRKSGRVPGDAFEFLPFDLSFKADEKGYYHIVTEGVSELFEGEAETVAKKCAELAIAIFLE